MQLTIYIHIKEPHTKWRVNGGVGDGGGGGDEKLQIIVTYIGIYYNFPIA
jgi:hypothetical protein